MAVKRVVLTANAPPPLEGILSQAIIANGMVYCSGSIGMDLNGNMASGDVAARTVTHPPKSSSSSLKIINPLTTTFQPQHQAIKNLSAVLAEAGSSIEHVVKVNVFLADMKDFAAMNEAYKQWWGDVKPCRT